MMGAYGIGLGGVRLPLRSLEPAVRRAIAAEFRTIAGEEVLVGMKDDGRVRYRSRRGAVAAEFRTIAGEEFLVGMK